jgi:hypothetical protein
MKPIPGTLHGVDRDFVFTRGREMDINETAVAEEFTK